MVAFLKKLEGSKGFHQIVDFINSTHIKYALTENPTIYVSLIYQFWQTASASTFENREMEITATIDGRVKTITEVSIRRHLKLEDSDGISTLPNTEIFEQLVLMGAKKTAWDQFSSNIATCWELKASEVTTISFGNGIGGYDWSYQSEEEHPINYALMDITFQESSFQVQIPSFLMRRTLVNSSEIGDVVEPKLLGETLLVSNIEDWNSGDDSEHLHYGCDKKVMRPVWNNHVVEPKTVRKNSFRPPVIEDWNSDDDSEVEFIPNVKDKTVSSSTEKIKLVKSARETVEKVIRPVWNNSSRVNHKNFANKMTHPHPNRRFVPQAVLTKSGKINTAGASVNTVVRPVNTACLKPTVNHPRSISNAYRKGYSQVTRPFNKYSEYKNSIFNKKVNTIRVKDTTARDRAVVSENKGKGVNAVKASACWGNPQQKEYKEKGVIDSGCSRHITGNRCYLTEYEDYDGGFISFGDGKGRISGKVLSSDFKLLDESQVLLRVPRKDNIYSVVLKSVVPTKGLTCLFAKDTIDESNLWHRRLGHINFI
ncbi:hypothetical protein Tco_0188628 [Tanacetum coccineum]